jgi:ABC-type Mn2+/Zn2+ transport system permease subunit
MSLMGDGLSYAVPPSAALGFIMAGQASRVELSLGGAAASLVVALAIGDRD